MRRFVWIPEVRPGTYLLFFRKGAQPLSWSLRDYSLPGTVTLWRGETLGWTADELERKVESSFEAPIVRTTDLDFWHRETLALNAKHGMRHDQGRTANRQSYPLLAESALLGLPKARKGHDMRRILTSANSEDWVTWNMLQLLQAVQPKKWWETLEGAAAAYNPAVRLGLAGDDEPKLQFWRIVAAPAEYEKRSRQRMAGSGVAKFLERSRKQGPVEGESEIDAVVDSRRFLIFLEAKLGSDVSMSTSYDPERNQIARNIDCLLESAKGREPVFWMLVRDRHAERAYVQIIEGYRSRPETLIRDLPHRNDGELRRVASRLAMIRWRELGEQWLESGLADELKESVRLELLSWI